MYADPRRAFGSDSLATMSGPRVVVMCFDRLDRDLAGAIAAIGRRDLEAAHTVLCHAQDLVTELLTMLDQEAWEHGSTLAGVYEYVVRLLVTANASKRLSLVEEAQRLIGELGAAFRAAVQIQHGQPQHSPIQQNQAQHSATQYSQVQHNQTQHDQAGHAPPADVPEPTAAYPAGFSARA